MRKLFILLIKYIPIIRMVGILICNTLRYFKICNKLSQLIDSIIGGSLITTFLIYICSHMFSFCIWHRILIMVNLLNLLLYRWNDLVNQPINELQLLITCYTTSITSIIVILIYQYNKYAKYKS